MKKIIIILFVLLNMLSQLANAQKKSHHLERLSQLASIAPDSLLPQIYYEMSMDASFTNSQLGIQYALKALDVASDLNNIYYQVKAFQALGFNERTIKISDASIKHYKEALALAQEHIISKLESQCNNNLAHIYEEIDSIDAAQNYTNKALKIANELQDSVEISNSYINIGIILHRIGKKKQAIEYLQESFELRKKYFDHYSQDYITPLWHIMDIYMEMEKYDKAKDVAHTILDENTDNDCEILSRVWYKMAQVYYKNRNLDSAVVVGKLSLRESIESMEPHRVDLICKLLDSIYIAQGDYDNAAKICQKYIVICDSLFNKELNNQIKTIQFTSEYLNYERYIDQEKQNNRLSLSILSLLLFALIGSGCFLYVSRRRDLKIKRLNRILTRQRGEIEHSLRYAHALQRAVLPDQEDFGSVFSDKFLIYIPCDIVSGDFYWRYNDLHHEMLVVADCTGHGVPGAMLTMVGTSILHDIANTGIRDAAIVLEKLRTQIKYMMAVNSDYKMHDGMDISLIVVNKHNMKMEFAGAYNNLVYIRDGKINTLKASRCPIGEYLKDIAFESQILQLMKGDEIYLMSDGYSSQFGGERESKIGQKKLLDMILANHNNSMEELATILKNYFYQWKGQLESVDDVTIAGFRV